MTENLFTVDADWLAARLGDSDLSIVGRVLVSANHVG